VDCHFWWTAGKIYIKFENGERHQALVRKIEKLMNFPNIISVGEAIYKLLPGVGIVPFTAYSDCSAKPLPLYNDGVSWPNLVVEVIRKKSEMSFDL
jgi:hypothetical protein